MTRRSPVLPSLLLVVAGCSGSTRHTLASPAARAEPSTVAATDGGDEPTEVDAEPVVFFEPIEDPARRAAIEALLRRELEEYRALLYAATLAADPEHHVLAVFEHRPNDDGAATPVSRDRCEHALGALLLPDLSALSTEPLLEGQQLCAIQSGAYEQDDFDGDGAPELYFASIESGRYDYDEEAEDFLRGDATTRAALYGPTLQAELEVSIGFEPGANGDPADRFEGFCEWERSPPSPSLLCETRDAGGGVVRVRHVRGARPGEWVEQPVTD